MKSKVLLFSVLKDKIGRADIELNLPEMLTGHELLTIIIEKYPAVQPLKKILKISVNRKYIQLDDPFNSAGEIAVFPPVSGG